MTLSDRLLVFMKFKLHDYFHKETYIRYENGELYLAYRNYYKIIYLPWMWDHYRSSFLNHDGTLYKHKSKRGFEETPESIKSWFAYKYILNEGLQTQSEQKRFVTMHGSMMEHRWRWFKWLPWPRKIRRYIDVEFNQEVGSQAGSWKGGCVGCSYDWKEGETQLECLRRMEAERRFD